MACLVAVIAPPNMPQAAHALILALSFAGLVLAYVIYYIMKDEFYKRYYKEELALFKRKGE